MPRRSQQQLRPAATVRRFVHRTRLYGWRVHDTSETRRSAIRRDCPTDFEKPNVEVAEVDGGRSQEVINTSHSWGAEDVNTHLQSICNATAVRRRCKQSLPDANQTTGHIPPTSLQGDCTEEVDDMLTIPSVVPSDYETDPHLSHLFSYLTSGSLPANDAQARTTLLLSKDFFNHTDGLLYRISIPRSKKQARVNSTEIRLALPQKYLAEVVQQCHNLGHFSKERNF